MEASISSLIAREIEVLLICINTFILLGQERTVNPFPSKGFSIDE